VRKYPTSTADFSELAKVMVKGGEANRAEVGRWGLNPIDLQKGLDYYQTANQKQEAAKAVLQISTVAFNSAQKTLKAEMSRWVSTLEANYGKTGDKLQEFGIAPRQLKPHKGPRAKKG
jgi:hypothetical protein